MTVMKSIFSLYLMVDLLELIYFSLQVVNGKWVTVNETTWTNGDGEEVAFYRVTVRKPLDASVSREELDEDNSIARSQRVPMKQEMGAIE